MVTEAVENSKDENGMRADREGTKKETGGEDEVKDGRTDGLPL
jgi:hypothetical protein